MNIMRQTLRLIVNRRPIQYNFENCMKVIRYIGNTIICITDVTVFVNRSLFISFQCFVTAQLLIVFKLKKKQILKQ